MRIERRFYSARLRLRTLLLRRRVEQELDEELRYHIDRRIEQEIAGGASPEEARYIAVRAMEGIEQKKEECRDVRGLNWIDNALQDFRYAIRQLGKNPGFAFTATFVLALGIAAAVTIFGLVEAALIEPLPYRDESRLVSAFESSPRDSRRSLSYLDFADWKNLNRVFSSMGAYALNGGFTLTTGSGAEPATGTRVSSGFFGTLGVTPVLGRDFRSNEDSPGAIPAVVISYDAWQERFGGRADVVGQAVTLNGIPRVIIGVLPREFHFAPYGAGEFWATLRGTDPCEQNRGCHNVNTVARLRDGISIDTASVEMRLIAQQLQKQYPDSNREVGGVSLVRLRDVVVGDVRPILLVLLSGAVVLLLIAYTNVVTLLLARFDSRRREIALRSSLGATSGRLFRQFVVESLTLAAAGSSLGLIFAHVGMRIMARLVPVDSMPYLRTLGLNLQTLSFACVLALLAGILFSLIPTVHMTLSERAEGLKEASRGNASLSWRRIGAKLVVVEVALAMVLMTGAVLLGRSLYSLLHIDMGMRPEQLVSAALHWPPTRYSSDEEKCALARRIVRETSALPGVTSVAISLTPPVGFAWGTTSFRVVGRQNDGERNEVLKREVSPGYFKTVQARLIRGRAFDETEDASKPRVAIINRSLAKKYFGEEDPIGRQIRFDWSPDSRMEVVGIVNDIKEGQLVDANLPTLYLPFYQNPVAWFAVLVRTSLNEQSIVRTIPTLIHQIDPDISVHDAVTMTERIHNSPAAYLHFSSAWLMGTFASVAFVLGIVGLYGAVAYSVGHRTREIGVRIALGAEPSFVYRLILKEAAGLVAGGTVLGIAGSVAAVTFLRRLFYGIRDWEVPTFAVVVSVLTLAALVASYIPARRAASVNPVDALRSE